MSQTSLQYNNAVTFCKDIFVKKMKDYGSAWRILRLSSITDQIYIKAQRIRSIEEKGIQKVEDGIKEEFAGIINYAVIATIQLEEGVSAKPDLNLDEAVKYFDKHIAYAKSLMEDKNHDYDEAWRKMRVSSMTDLILMKLHRVKQIEDNKGETIISEGIDANYYDIINYAVFALIKLEK
ncbi:MAG: DUF1599 domain-containing protein [Bacteroidia bacterium]